MAELDFEVTISNKDFLEKVEQIRIGIKAVAQESEEQRQNIETSFGQITIAAGKTSNEMVKFPLSLKKAFSAISKEMDWQKLVEDVVKVRGEFQQLEFSFTALLQNKGQAEALVSQMSETAVKTPFDLTELGEGAKQLIGYGMQADEVNATLLKLGDIASGLGMPLSQVASLYGSVMNQGTLSTGDLEQFAASGIPMLQGLADMYGVTTDRVNEMVTAGQVGFPEVQTVIGNLTNEGGRFYNLMDQKNGTITAKIGNLSDAWNLVLNSIGESQEGVINGTLDGAQYLLDNYEQLGKALLTLIEIYGVYKTACIVQMVITQSLAATQMQLGVVMGALKNSFIALTATMNLNPWVLAATAIIGLGIAMWNFRDSATDAEKAQRKLNDEIDRFNQKEVDRKQRAEELIRVIQDETETKYAKVKAYEELQKQSPALTKKYDLESLAILNEVEAQKELNEEREKFNYDNILANIDKYTEYVKRLQDANTWPDLKELQEPIGKEYGYGLMSSKLEQAQEDLRNWQKMLNDIDRIKKEAKERGQPIETRIKIAQTDLNEIKDEYNKVNTLILLEEAKNPLIVPLHLQLELARLGDIKQQAQMKLDGLKQEQLKNGNSKGLYQQDLANAREEWLNAKKDYADILKDKEATTEAVQNAETNMNTKADAYRKLGGNTDSNAGTDRKANILEKEKQLKDVLEAQAHDRKRLIEDWENENCQAEIDAMEEGSDKKLAQMAFNHEKELQELEREKAEYLQQKVQREESEFNAREDLAMAKNPKHERRTFDASTVKLTDSENAGFENRKTNMMSRQDQELKAFSDSEKQAMNESLKEYGTYMEKRQAIIDIYNDKIAKAKLPGEKEALENKKNQEVSILDEGAIKDISAFGQLFSDMKGRSVKDMRSIAAEAEKVFAYLKNGTFQIDGEGNGLFGISKEKFDILQETPEKLDDVEGSIKNLNVEANNSDVAITRMKQGFDTLFNSKGDPTKVQEGLNLIKSSLNDVMQAAQFFSDSLASIGDAFGNETMGKIAEGMNVAMDAAGAAMSGAEAGMKIGGPWGAAAGAAIGLVSSLSSSLAKLHDAKHESAIQNIQEQIEVLEETYEKLGDSLEKAYSSDASELIDQQNELLEQQKVLIQNQITEEQSKKKADGGRIEEWQKQIEDIDAAIGKNQEKKIDVIFGEDLKAAIDNFAQAYADAWAAGDDRAKSSKDLVKDMIKQMVTEAIKAASSEPMEKLREKLAGFFSDGIISAWEREQIEKDAEKMANDLDKQFGWADEYMKDDKEVESSSQSSTRGGFQSMSQETGDELNGRFTALQIANEEIRNSMLFVVANLTSLTSSVADGSMTLSEMRNLAVTSNSYLQDIAGYTKRILMDFGTKLDDISNNTKRL